MHDGETSPHIKWHKSRESSACHEKQQHRLYDAHTNVNVNNIIKTEHPTRSTGDRTESNDTRHDKSGEYAKNVLQRRPVEL